ncbi:MAG: flagellar basal body rod protein FlgC [Pseudomonadota bacterium]
MDELMRTMAAAASGMRAQSARIRMSAENIANADTPGYQRKVVTFEEMYDRTNETRAVSTGEVKLDSSPVERQFQPNHPLADADGYLEGSNVNLMIEVADSREANRTYQANLRMFEQARDMNSALIDLLRK